MKDNNVYLLGVEYKPESNASITVGKNYRIVPFNELPQREQEIIISMAKSIYDKLVADYEKLIAK